MEIESRSYNPGSIFRPKPVVLTRSESHLMIIVTSWTGQDVANKNAQAIADHIEGHAEAKDPLREALLGVAQDIYKHDNLKQARLLIEALVVKRQGSMVSWAQVGQPNLYLIRKGRVAPLSVQADLSVLDPTLPPLPMVGLGLTDKTNVLAGSARCQPGDQLLFLAQSFEPAWPAWGESPSFQTVSQALIEAQPDLALWCGVSA